jgi:drug/metabolite transporter (DMT)-like permease
MRGILFMVAATFMFAIMDVISKLLAQNYPPVEVVAARYFVQVVLLLAILAPTRGLGMIRSRRPGLQIVRGTVLCFSSVMFVAALAVMPIAEAAAIGSCAPLMVVLLSIPMLRERIGTPSRVAVGTGFIGALIIIRPGAEIFTWAALLPLFSAVGGAMYQVLTRKISGVDDTFTSLFYPAMVGTVLLSCIMPFIWVAPRSVTDALLMVGVGAAGTGGHFLMIRSFTHAPASIASSITYTQLIFSMISGYLIFGQFPDGWSLVGMGVVVLAGLFIASRHRSIRN